ncbi:tRNA pseudouridine(55) synthase TruB [Alkalihalobacillus sp. 1P02AB]|uniref:tRNA pseudouridine(55) synthase TruB n=1 Tax=Alkalihalobacillus sp. 1P02AB TaxID=3132260 RepID=UPI0039A4B142
MNKAGVLSLYKPAGMTSHDCVAKLRKLFQTKKIGHTGTLDPAVTGVLPICIGKATKVAQYMSDYAKAYEAEVTIGYATTTEDQTGEIIEEKAVTNSIPSQEIDEVIASFLGEMNQTPPMYSAVRVNGRRLYDYARKGETVERPSRIVTIEEINRLGDVLWNQEKQTFSFRLFVKCSKGTYVRTLAVDIGKKLGFPAHMSKLQRVSSGPFTLEDCLSFEELEQMESIEERCQQLKPLEIAIAHIPKYTVNDELEAKIKVGSVLPQDKFIDENRFTFYNKEGQCLAIYKQHPTKAGLIKPEKMIWTSLDE